MAGGGVWFTADTHFGHEMVAKLRGFDTAQAHDYHLARQWSKVVGDDDQVWVLGDLAMSAVEYALELVGTLPGTKHLIAGNHDPVHPMHRGSHKKLRRYLEVFESVQAFARRRIDGQDVLLSHFSYGSDHTDEIRYSQYRLRDEGRWLLHGHTHQSHTWTSKNELHVGLDSWALTPVNIDTLAQMMRRGIPDDWPPASPTLEDLVG